MSEMNRYAWDRTKAADYQHEQPKREPKPKTRRVRKFVYVELAEKRRAEYLRAKGAQA